MVNIRGRCCRTFFFSFFSLFSLVAWGRISELALSFFRHFRPFFRKGNRASSFFSLFFGRLAREDAGAVADSFSPSGRPTPSPILFLLRKGDPPLEPSGHRDHGSRVPRVSFPFGLFSSPSCFFALEMQMKLKADRFLFFFSLARAEGT